MASGQGINGSGLPQAAPQPDTCSGDFIRKVTILVKGNDTAERTVTCLKKGRNGNSG